MCNWQGGVEGLVQERVSQLVHAEPSVGFVGYNEGALCCHCFHGGVFFKGEVWRERRSEASHHCCVCRVSTKSVCRLGRCTKTEFLVQILCTETGGQQEANPVLL